MSLSTCAIVDAKLPMYINNTLRNVINILIHIPLIAAMLPWFLIALPFAGAYYVLLYAVFRVGIWRLQRFQLESMAPLLTHVDSSIHGLSSVHAYQRVDDFQRRSVSCVLKSLYIGMLYLPLKHISQSTYLRPAMFCASVHCCLTFAVDVWH